MQNRPVMLMLGYAGLLPFYAFLLGAWQLRDWPAAISVQGFVIYSWRFFAFWPARCGAVQTVDQPSISRLLVSNGLVLFAVAAVLTAKAWLASVALMTAYLALLWYERGAETLPAWYQLMRRNLTLGVVAAHGLFLFSRPPSPNRKPTIPAHPHP